MDKAPAWRTEAEQPCQPRGRRLHPAPCPSLCPSPPGEEMSPDSPSGLVGPQASLPGQASLHRALGLASLSASLSQSILEKGRRGCVGGGQEARHFQALLPQETCPGWLCSPAKRPDSPTTSLAHGTACWGSRLTTATTSQALTNLWGFFLFLPRITLGDSQRRPDK